MQSTQERGGCLTIWLILMVIGFALSAVSYLLNSAMFAQVFPNAPAWSFTAFGVVAIVGVVSAIGLWMWKKWGFYAYLAVAVAAIVLNALMGQLVAGIVAAAIGTAILWYLIKDKWVQFA